MNIECNYDDEKCNTINFECCDNDIVYKIQKNVTLIISENQTKFINDQEFIFKGYMKIMGFFMQSAFEQQSRVYLQNFKEFAEND